MLKYIQNEYNLKSDQSISNQINLNQCKLMYTNNIQSYAYNYNKIHSESHKFN